MRGIVWSVKPVGCPRCTGEIIWKARRRDDLIIWVSRYCDKYCVKLSSNRQCDGTYPHLILLQAAETVEILSCARLQSLRLRQSSLVAVDWILGEH